MKSLFYIALILLFTSCLKEDELKKEYTSFAPKDIGDGWEIGNCTSNNIDSLLLNNAFRSVYNNESNWPMRSLSVFRNGELIAESYLKDESDRNRPRAIWSCTKQIMGITTGLLWDDNLIFMTDRIEQFIPNYLDGHGDKKNILIEDLLSMRSGIGFHNDVHSDVYRKRETENSVTFALNLPLESAPGNVFNYNDGNPQIISAVIQNVSGQKADVYAKKNLFDKIGFSNYSWERYPKDGITMGGFGIQTTPREMAKIGQLVLNNGRWDSTQVISEDWISLMLSETSSVPGYSQLKFGYFWWINPSKNYYIMWGHGGQYVFVMPDKNAMVVITSLEQIEAEFAVWIEDATQIADQINKALL